MIAIDPPGDWPATVKRVRSTARSHVGRVRTINEDRVFDWPDGNVWAVVDGMGGHRGGDQAAQSTVDALRALTMADGDASPATVLAALQAANDAIRARNAEQGEQAGATVVALTLHGDAATVAWAGDSRCYRIRDGAVHQLTHDHSVVQELVDAGLLSPAAAARHPQANVITRALGVERACDIDSRVIDVAAGDRFLICSDGLSNSLREGDLCDGALRDGGLEPLADDLIAQALRRDGTDNISLILIEPYAVAISGGMIDTHYR